MEVDWNRWILTSQILFAFGIVLVPLTVALGVRFVNRRIFKRRLREAERRDNLRRGRRAGETHKDFAIHISDADNIILEDCVFNGQSDNGEEK